MGLLSRIRPISYFKAHAAQILAELGEGQQPMILTQNGEAKAVVQDIASYERTQETLALLKLLAMGRNDFEAGRSVSLDDVRKEFGISAAE